MGGGVVGRSSGLLVAWSDGRTVEVLVPTVQMQCNCKRPV